MDFNFVFMRVWWGGGGGGARGLPWIAITLLLFLVDELAFRLYQNGKQTLIVHHNGCEET